MGASLISTYQAFISWRPGTLYDTWPGDGVKLSLVKMVQCNFIYFHQKGALLQWSKTIWSAVAAFTFQTCDKCWKGLELERTSLKLGLEMMAFPQSIRQWQAIDFNSLYRYLWMQVARQILYIFFGHGWNTPENQHGIWEHRQLEKGNSLQTCLFFGIRWCPIRLENVWPTICFFESY